MNQYYYTVASLPMLFYDQDLPISREEFMERCGIELADEDMDLIKKTSIQDLDTTDPTCPVLEAWRAWEKALRNELVKLRAQAKGWDAEESLRETEDIFGVQQVAREAFAQDSPLQGEDVLNRARWSFLDDIERGHHFDTEKLAVYSLKLQLLERKASFDREEGSQAFENVVESLSSA